MRKESRSSSDANRLKAIQKSFQETLVPADIDIPALVKRSLEAYHDSEKATSPLELETAGLARIVADKLCRFHKSVLDIVFPVIAPITLFVFIGAIRKRAMFNIDRIDLVLVIALLIASSIYMLYYVYRERRLARHISAALVAGVIVLALTGLYFYRESSRVDDISISLLKYRVERLALASMEIKRMQGAFLPHNTTKEYGSIKTLELSPDEVVYRVIAKGGDGELLATIKQMKGELYRMNGEKRKLMSRLLIGKIEEIEKDVVTVSHSSDGSKIRLKFDDMEERPYRGATVALAYDPSAYTISSIESLECAIK